MSLNVSNASTVSGRHVSGNFLLRNWWLARPAWERKEELRAPRQFSNFAFAHWQPFSAVGQASAVGGRVLQLQDWLRGISWPSQDRNLVMKYDEIGRILRNGLTLLLSFHTSRSAKYSMHDSFLPFWYIHEEAGRGATEENRKIAGAVSTVIHSTVWK